MVSAAGPDFGGILRSCPSGDLGGRVEAANLGGSVVVARFVFETTEGEPVTAIQKEIVDGFFTRLSKKEGIDEALVKALLALFTASGKLKADDLAAAYVAAKKDGAV